MVRPVDRDRVPWRADHRGPHILLRIENSDNDIHNIKLEGKFRGFQIADGCMIA